MSLVRPYIVGCLVMVVPEAKAHHAVSRTGAHPARCAGLSSCPKEDTGTSYLGHLTISSGDAFWLVNQVPFVPWVFCHLLCTLEADEGLRHFWLGHPSGKGTGAIPLSLFSPSLSPELQELGLYFPK